MRPQNLIVLLAAMASARPVAHTGSNSIEARELEYSEIEALYIERDRSEARRHHAGDHMPSHEDAWPYEGGRFPHEHHRGNGHHGHHQPHEIEEFGHPHDHHVSILEFHTKVSKDFVLTVYPHSMVALTMMSSTTSSVSSPTRCAALSRMLQLGCWMESAIFCLRRRAMFRRYV